MDNSLPLGFILLGIALVIYFIPSIVAHNRQHKNKTAIIVLNFALGWTLIGWVAALVWAVTVSTPQTVVVYKDGPRP